ncbi:HNH endonuclease signature motif containing protein [Kytococcus sp. Marseille-QA3725]
MTQARRAGRATHDDDAQFAGAKNATDTRRTHRDAQLAAALGNHHPTPPAPGTGQDGGPGLAGDLLGDESEGSDPLSRDVARPLAVAMDAGLVTGDHVMVILEELDGLPQDVTAQQRWQAEEVLVAKAQRLTPSRLRIAARRVLADLSAAEQVVDAHQDQRVATQEQAAWEAASFWMRDNHDGTVFGQFTLPALQGHMLAKTLSAMTSPRRLHQQHTDEATGSQTTGTTRDRDTGWGDRQIDFAHEKGKALAELITRMPTDHLGERVNATVLVTIPLTSLRGETDRVGITDTGTEVSAGQVRRLAAEAGLVPVVLGGNSQPLDLGRKTRFFTEPQRRALALTYPECAEEHCDRPFAWCEIHHATPWRPPPTHTNHPPDTPPRGRTDLANAIPLCGRHHRRLDDPTYTHTITRNTQGTATIHFHHAHTRPGAGATAATGTST